MGQPSDAPPPARAAATPATALDRRRLWLSRRALLLHLTVLLVVPAFLGLFWWQVQRVRQGNTLSWAYVFEWPFFTGYAVYLWWKLVHDPPETGTVPSVPVAAAAAPLAAAAAAGAVPDVPAGTPPGPSRGVTPATVPADDPETGGLDQDDRELADYNRYLAALDASGRRKRW